MIKKPNLNYLSSNVLSLYCIFDVQNLVLCLTCELIKLGITFLKNVVLYEIYLVKNYSDRILFARLCRTRFLYTCICFYYIICFFPCMSVINFLSLSKFSPNVLCDTCFYDCKTMPPFFRIFFFRNNWNTTIETENVQ